MRISKTLLLMSCAIGLGFVLSAEERPGLDSADDVMLSPKMRKARREAAYKAAAMAAPKAAEPVAPKAAEPALAKMVEPAVSKAIEPVAPKAVEPVAPKAVEPVAPKAAEPALAKMVEPAVSKVVEPVVPKAAEPVAPKKIESVRVPAAKVAPKRSPAVSAFARPLQPVVVEKVKVVEKPVPVKTIVTNVVEKPVIVEKVKVVEKPVPVKTVVTNVVEKPVEKIVEKRVLVDRPVTVTNTVERVVEVPKVVTNTVERVVEKPVTVERVVEKPVTNFVDRVVEKPTFIEKRVEVEKIVEKKVVVTNTPAAAPYVRSKRAPYVKKPLTGRPAKITSVKTDYDRKEGVALFSGKVHVDDEQYQMHADKLYVFTDNSSGTNQLKRLVAIGHVALTNEQRMAYATKATYFRPTGKVILYSGDGIRAEVKDESKPQDQAVRGAKIVFWMNSDQVEVFDSDISAPSPAGKGGIKKAMGF